MVSTDSASCTRFLTGTPPHQVPGTQMGVSLLCNYKSVDVYELYFLNNISGEMVQLKCLTCEKGYHALTASFSICVANRGQCKLNKCLSLWLSLTDLVTAMDSNCRNWAMCILLAPFPWCVFCPWPTETLQALANVVLLCISLLAPLLQCKAWMMLHGWARGCAARKRLVPEMNFLSQCPEIMQSSKQSCDLTGTAV